MSGRPKSGERAESGAHGPFNVCGRGDSPLSQMSAVAKVAIPM